MISKQHLINNRSYFIALGLSLILFVIKGIQYALIESYVPLLFILIIHLLFYYTNKTSWKRFRAMIKFWAILIIIWSLVRLAIQILFYFSENVTETHIRDQFTLLQNVISVMILIIGIYLIKKRSDLVNNSE